MCILIFDIYSLFLIKVLKNIKICSKNNNKEKP